MDKALEFLEKYVQWVAVGLGGLFLAWMLYAYVLVTPVAVTDGAKTYTPGDVDDTISNLHAKSLQEAIDRTSVEAPPAGNSNNLLVPFDETLKTPVQVASFAPFAFESQQAEQLKVKEEVVGDPALRVTTLPTVPPTEIVEALAKRAYVGPALAVAGAAGAPQPEVAPPVAPIAPGQPPAANALPPGHDMSYVRISYNINAAKIAEAFEAVKVPGSLTTTVLSAQLMRQEQGPDGKWSDATPVPTIKNNLVLYPVPPATAGPQALADFRNWIESPQALTDLLRPPFYPVLFGEGPWDPSMDDALPKFDPEAARLEAARIAKEKADAKKAAQPQRPTPTPRPSRSSRGNNGGGGGSQSAADPERPSDLGALVGARPMQAAPGAGMGDTPGATPGTPADGVTPPAVVAPGAGLAPTNPLPTQPAFVPAQTQPLLGWAYDETVVEGHTYRYQVVYSLRSPVYDTNLTSPPELAATFELKGTPDENAWSPAVEVKPTAEFYLATNNWSPNNIPGKIKVEVYKWAQGKWQVEQFEVAPGDRIGDTKNGVDYGTHVTIVDLKFDERGINATSGQKGWPYVLLLTADGRLQEREPTADKQNNRRLSLDQAIKAAAAAAPGAVPAAMPGMPVAPGGGAVPPGAP